MTADSLDVRYAQIASDMVTFFEFEYCESCSQDVHRHNITPDPLGLPHLWCLDEDKNLPVPDPSGKEIAEVAAWRNAMLVLIEPYEKGNACTRCGRALNAHNIGPDKNGKPAITCMD